MIELTQEQIKQAVEAASAEIRKRAVDEAVTALESTIRGAVRSSLYEETEAFVRAEIGPIVRARLTEEKGASRRGRTEGGTSHLRRDRQGHAGQRHGEAQQDLGPRQGHGRAVRWSSMSLDIKNLEKAAIKLAVDSYQLGKEHGRTEGALEALAELYTQLVASPRPMHEFLPEAFKELAAKYVAESKAAEAAREAKS